ncbi:MAG: DnaA/Hda family protein [Desulfovibrionaceae bacterium]
METKQAFREHLQQTCSESELARWFDPLLMSISREERRVSVTFPHGFFARWFESTIQDKFEAQLNRFLGGEYTIRYSAPSSDAGASRVVETGTKAVGFPFDSQFIFDSFLVNKKNYFPMASAKEVTKQVGSLFNPFIICGNNGSGKSHLLRAIANEISKKTDPASMLLLSMDELKNLYSSTFSGDVFRARNHIFSHDFLFVDDFHQIQKYDGMQQEMIIIFNHFFDRKKQMVFCCQGKVTACDFLDPVLLSRLEWGLMVTLKQPDLEVRIDFIREQSRTKKLPLSKEQILSLAQRFTDFRYLQGILTKLVAFRELVKKDISKRDFELILNNTEEKTADALQAENVISLVAEHFSVSAKEIRGSKRHAHIAQARQIAMYLCKTLLPVSYPALGRTFGGKDHSTVLYSVKKIEQLRDDDKDLNSLLKELKKKCLLYGRE